MNIGNKKLANSNPRNITAKCGFLEDVQYWHLKVEIERLYERWRRLQQKWCLWDMIDHCTHELIASVFSCKRPVEIKLGNIPTLVGLAFIRTRLYWVAIDFDDCSTGLQVKNPMGYVFWGCWLLRFHRPPNITGSCQCFLLSSRTLWYNLLMKTWNFLFRGYK